MDKKPTAAEIADRARLLRQKPPQKPPPLPKTAPPFLPIAKVKAHEQTKVGPWPTKSPAQQMAEAQARARAANESIRDSRTELLSEPATSAPDWQEEPATSPESPQGRFSIADIRAFEAWQRSQTAPVEQTPPVSGRNPSLIPAKVSPEELERARASMRAKEAPAWLVATAKWLAAPLLALLTTYGIHLQAQTQLVREEAARVKAETEAQKADATSMRARLTDLESELATTRVKLQDAQAQLKKGAETPLEINPARRRRPPP